VPYVRVPSLVNPGALSFCLFGAVDLEPFLQVALLQSSHSIAAFLSSIPENLATLDARCTAATASVRLIGV
jgi:hypothetical protein